MENSSDLDLEADQIDSPDQNFIAQFQAAFSDSMIGVDVTLRVAKEAVDTEYFEFKCHKFVLVARSEFFKVMFTHQMKESLTNTVDLPDMTVSTLQTLLKFFYTDRINKNDVNLELLRIADLFLIKELKEYCAAVLSRQIQAEDAVAIFIAAKSYNAENLALEALNVISANYDEVKDTPDWKEHGGDDLSQLMAETLATKETSNKATSSGNFALGNFFDPPGEIDTDEEPLVAVFGHFMNNFNDNEQEED